MRVHRRTQHNTMAADISESFSKKRNETNKEEKLVFDEAKSADFCEQEFKVEHDEDQS